jgi:sporulation protein YlmC with PRC-barrel domain
MRGEITLLYGLSIYTDRGKYVGKVDEVVMNTDERGISGLGVKDINTNMFDVEEKGIIIPYRWVIAIGDIVIIKEIKKLKKTG